MQRRILPIYHKGSGCDYHRIQLPFMFPGSNLDVDFYKDFTLETAKYYYDNSHALVFNRVPPFTIERLNNFKKLGLKIICDIDDYWILHFEHPLYEHFKNSQTQLIIENMKNADLVTCTTERLYNRIKEYNSNVHIVPNALPFDKLQFIEGFKDEAFVYAGQGSHLKDIQLLKQPIKELAATTNVKITYAGYQDTEHCMLMEKIFEQIGQNRYMRINQKPLTAYMNAYDYAYCSLVPLVGNAFNSCKSNLKLLEAAAKKIPVIVSHVPPYSDDKDAPVLWVKQKSDWVKHIKAISESEAMREDYGNALSEWANKKYNLFNVNKNRFELYETLF